MKASVCIEMIYTDLPFIDRIKKAGDQGFDGIEFWTWWDKDLDLVKKTAEGSGVEITAFQSNRGGTLVNPEHRKGFIDGIKDSLGAAKDMDCRAMFILTDELGDDRSVKHKFPDLSEAEKYRSVVDGLTEIAPLAVEAGVTLVLEPLNNLVDHAGYWLKYADTGYEIVRKINSPGVKLLFDIYHQQVTEGNIIDRLLSDLDSVGHVHVADVPGRHEPGTGELNYAVILNKLREAGYDKYVGLEYDPVAPSEQAALASLKLIKG